MKSATVPLGTKGVWFFSGWSLKLNAVLDFLPELQHSCRKSAGIPAGNPPDWKNLAENLPDSKELTESQFFQGSRYPGNPENATPLKRNLCF